MSTVALPCEIGETVYTLGVDRKSGNPCVIAHTVEGFEIWKSGIFLKLNWRAGAYEVKRASDIGKTWFLSRQHAERAIQTPSEQTEDKQFNLFESYDRQPETIQVT